jgi:hypothetical protein
MSVLPGGVQSEYFASYMPSLTLLFTFGTQISIRHAVNKMWGMRARVVEVWRVNRAQKIEKMTIFDDRN